MASHDQIDTSVPVRGSVSVGGWVLVVVSTCLVVTAGSLVGLPAWLVVTLAISAVVFRLGAVHVPLVRSRSTLVLAGLAQHLADDAHLRVLDYLEEPTHGHLSPAYATLRSVEARVRQVDPSDSTAASVSRAAEIVGELETAIRRTHAARAALRDRKSGAMRAGGLAAKNSYHADDDPMSLYQDPLNLPGWIRSPRARDALTWVGSILDDVRLLHDADIEWTVLLFTLWTRLVLIACAPVLSGATFGRPPTNLDVRSLPWAIATLVSFGTALLAPRIASEVMRRDRSGFKVRRALLTLEVPVAVAALILTPCWPVAAFAAGWTNWWQRPTFSWLKLVGWTLATVGPLCLGMALMDVSAWRIGVEALISLFVVLVIGSSQGAMLPISLATLARVVLQRLSSPSAARRDSDEQISRAIEELFEAASVIENHAEQEDADARLDAARLRGIAAVLANRADARGRRPRRVPQELSRLIEAGLESGGGPRSGSPSAAYWAADASRVGTDAPLTILPPSFYSRDLARSRLHRRVHARSLMLLVVKVVEEARQYGTGGLQTRCHRDGDRVILRFANRLRTAPVPPGRGTGESTLRVLAAEIPGCILERRGMVSGDFIDLPPAAERFGVEVSLDAQLFASPGRDHEG